MSFTTAANPPDKGLFSPEPKRPSITTSSCVKIGGLNCDSTSEKLAIPDFSSFSLLVSQSTDSLFIGLNK